MTASDAYAVICFRWPARRTPAPFEPASEPVAICTGVEGCDACAPVVRMTTGGGYEFIRWRCRA
jgi:hypothetical protein